MQGLVRLAVTMRFYVSENGIQKAPLLLQECFVLVTQERFELTTHRLEGGCSIQLSY